MTRVIDLSTLTAGQGFIIQGDEAGDQTGYSVSSAGDVNGDGIDDMIIGAPYGNYGGNNAGEAYVVYGTAGTTRGTVDLSTLTASQGFIVQGETSGDGAGYSVSSAGDVNGDGIDDLIIGALNGGDGGSSPGKAYVVYGTAGTTRGTVDLSTLTASQGFIVQGDTSGDYAGYSVSSAGDVNGDGIDDLIIGAPYGYDGGRNAGEAYVVYGTAGTTRGTVDLSTLTASQGFIVQGDSAGDHAGYSVSSAGDVNGDGIDDLIIGAPSGDDGGSNAGEAYVVYGTAGTARGTVDLSTLTASQGFIVQGDTVSGNTGISVSSAGDVNGDGIDDLIIGAPYDDSVDGGGEVGEAYVIYGTAGTTRSTVDLSALTASQGFIIQGDTDVDHAGYSVSSAGDVNGDGFDDLIIGAPGGDDGGTDAGETYVIYGEATPYDYTTTSFLFQEAGGQTAFMAQLALAAYHLETGTGQEREGTRINTANFHGEVAYAQLQLTSGLRLLDSSDMPGLALQPGEPGRRELLLHPFNSESEFFPLDGLSNGIYTSSNAAALIVRSGNAIFVSFRGTNDASLFGSPDMDDWLTIRDHYAEFRELRIALKAYIEANDDIDTLYITGHSLGGAMVETFLQQHDNLRFAGVDVVATTFASPGAAGDPVEFDEGDVSNFRIHGDPVPAVGNGTWRDTSGDINVVYSDLEGLVFEYGLRLHSIKLYRDFAQFFADNNLTTTLLHGIDYDRIYVDVKIIDAGDQRYRVGQSADDVSGSRYNDIILGGANSDTLKGKAGDDHLDGGNGTDKLYGGLGTDYLYGRDGADTLKGGEGDDFLYGGDKSDILIGGNGRDKLYGGNGADQFRFNSLLETNSTENLSDADIIMDWDHGPGNDVINLKSIDAKKGGLWLGNQAFDWIGSDSFSGQRGELRYQIGPNKTKIMGDLDGDGVADFQIILAGIHYLSEQDFIL